MNLTRSMVLALFFAALAPVWVCAAEGEPARPASTFEDRLSRTAVTFPGGYWRGVSRAEQQQKTRGGCSGGGGQMPAAYVWAGRHDDIANVRVTCWMVPRSFHVRTAADLEHLKAAVLETQGKAERWTGVVDSHEETVRGDMMVHRAKIKITTGDRSTTTEMAHFFLRRADGDKGVVWYQLWYAAPDDVRDDLVSEFDAIVDSFRYTKATLPIAEFYERDASDEQVLTPDQIAESFAPSRGTPWLPIIAMVGVVVFFMRPRRRGEPVARK